MKSRVKRWFSRPHLTAEDRAAMAKPWFHNFAPLGHPTEQGEPVWVANQLEKQSPVFRHIRDALLRCPRDASGVDLFCTDGLFGLYALSQGAGTMDLFDGNVVHDSFDPIRMEQTKAMAKVLGFEDRATVRALDPFDVSSDYDFGISSMVLCNVLDPARLLDLLRARIRGPLVIQTPVSLLNLSIENFESPAKHRPWGSRFSQEWLVRAAVDVGWTVVSESTVELPGNSALADRGSASLLCV